MKLLRVILVVTIVFTVALAPAVAGASDKKEISEARKIWDTVWRIVNFLILAFIIVKVLRRPLINYLKIHGEELEKTLDKSKAALAEVEEEYRQAEERLAGIEKLAGEIQEYMRQDAERTQAGILEEARVNSDHIIAHAREMADSMIQRARAEVKNDLVLMAMKEAETVVRRHIEAEDQARLIGEYLGQLSQAAAS